MKILHSADWHLDSPLCGKDERLQRSLNSIPGRLADLVRRHGCDLVLLSGDLFDGPPSSQNVAALKAALREMQVPVFIAPGNHDYYSASSLWSKEFFPKNVHIFTRSTMESVTVPELDCTVYGAGYTYMDCPPLLQNFRAKGNSRYHVAVLHGDPMLLGSPYCPITSEQVRQSGLQYLALGHIHRKGSFRAGKTLCAWPGCPMGRGFDEQGQKGVFIVTLDSTASLEFVPLSAAQFHELTVDVTGDPIAALEAVLPAAGSEDYFRVTLTGECEVLDTQAIGDHFARFPHLTLKDETSPALDVWASAGEDTLEGTYFGLLRDTLEGKDERSQMLIRQAATISRKLMNGQEVTLP
jgi:DNA repair exonuclease SbcCD nuclease subunit